MPRIHSPARVRLLALALLLPMASAALAQKIEQQMSYEQFKAAGLDQLTPADILFGFERSHPPPALRTPVIQQTAGAWRATGGRGLPILF